ncbi:iron permease [Meredithblackwellia eburnea MCA 4105]
MAASPTSTIVAPPELDLSKQALANDDNPKPKGKGWRFWMVFLSLCMSTFLSALDLTAVSTVLPTIANTFHSSQYSWVGSSYALTSTALIPWTGGIAHLFGRKATMLGSLIIFAVGSAVTGAAPSMSVVILGRSIQGIGGGGILTMTEIVVCDLVPLAERGPFFGIVGAVWAIASAIGPSLGGALATGGAWRWLFYLNLPLAAIAIVLVFFFLNISVPPRTLREKLALMDYWNVVFVAGSTSAILGLTWGGDAYAWSSYKVLVPLVLGLAGMIAFVFLERRLEHPTVPFDILSNRTTLIGFITNFLHGIVSLAIIYFFPVYFQSTKGYSAVKSGVSMFSLSFTIAPFAIVCGVSVTILGRYKPQNLIGWGFAILGFGLCSLLTADSSKAAWVCFPIVLGIGVGLLYAGTTFPTLAPLEPQYQAKSMAFFGFTRAFGQVFGITIGTTILQNELVKKLPQAFFAQFGKTAGASAYSIIPIINSIEEPLRHEVRVAFAGSLQTIWQSMIGIAGLGLIIAAFMKHYDLATTTDSEWGLEERKPTGIDVEKGSRAHSPEAAPAKQ